jgi:esterase/lipase
MKQVTVAIFFLSLLSLSAHASLNVCRSDYAFSMGGDSYLKLADAYSFAMANTVNTPFASATPCPEKSSIALALYTTSEVDQLINNVKNELTKKVQSHETRINQIEQALQQDIAIPDSVIAQIKADLRKELKAELKAELLQELRQ